MASGRIVLDAPGIERALRRMAMHIVERTPAAHSLTLVGVHTRGAHVADRLARLISADQGIEVPVGIVDVGTWRSPRGGDMLPDLEPIMARPFPGFEFDLDIPLSGATVVICDDVLYTGRTVWATVEAILAAGSPARVELAALVDRRQTELPIHATYAGLEMNPPPGAWISVELNEHDGHDRVLMKEHGAVRAVAAHV